MMNGHGLTGRLVAILLLLLLPLAGWAADAPPSAVQGRLHVAGAVPARLALQGEWGFAWGKFVDPAWQTLPATAFARVPAHWNALGADGKPPGENGWGSYVLQVDCPAGESLALEAVGQRTASRLFVNGTLVAQHGRPGPSAEAGWAAIHTRVPITREFACPLRITLHISNFDHRAGGFVRPLLAGDADQLQRGRETRLAFHAVLLSAYLFTGLLALIFFGVRRRESTPLAYGLFCLVMFVYADMIGERLLLRPLPPELSWHVYMRIEYLSWLGAMALFLLTLRGLFPAEIHRRAVQAVLGALGVGALAVVLLAPGVYSYLVLPGQALAVLVGAYFTFAMVRAQGRSPFDARVLLAGMGAVVTAQLLDLLLIDTGAPDRKFSTIGFALFLLSPAVVIARRLSHALNAEERSRTLEENARLREDVERMSRHDLKIPLNSIVGAARLLHDSGELGKEQRELLGVLQRAALRMVEMVNLSLGLYRMETGTYEFRPQAVDLQEVVTRVMVDLHGYAEAANVTLHRRGSERAPLRVRGEELLCYSIVANLVKNAVEATGPGGRVSIGLERGDPVTLTIHNPGEVPPGIAERFFDKYVTGGKSGGTGLGTYSARLMAKAQRGNLAMRTGPEGTTLTLTLRSLRDAPERAPSAVPQDRPLVDLVRAMPPRAVLVVDDDEFTRFVTQRFLPAPPFDVETAANGAAAIESMERRWPDFLLVDMEMPVRDGLQTVLWVREQEEAQGRPRCSVVMLSGNDDDDSVARAIRAGADRFLVKPVAREVLFDALLKLDAMAASRPVHTGWPDLAQDGPVSAADELVRIDAEWFEQMPEFMRLQRDTFESMARALDGGDRARLQFLAHRAFGGLATLGLAWAARHSRIIEEQAQTATEEDLRRRIEALREHLARVRFESA